MADKEKRMSPKKYSEYLQKVNLASISFKKYSVNSHKERFEAHMEIDVRHETSYKLEENDDKKAITSIKYTLTAYKKKKTEFVVKIDCLLEAILESEEPFDEDFMDIYLDRNLNYNTWPYFREFVQDATQKIGIPPLTLPFFKV